jgi:hypothetical protein
VQPVFHGGGAVAGARSGNHGLHVGSSAHKLSRSFVCQLSVGSGGHRAASRPFDLPQCSNHGSHIGLETDDPDPCGAVGENRNDLVEPVGYVRAVVQGGPVLDQSPCDGSKELMKADRLLLYSTRLGLAERRLPLCLQDSFWCAAHRAVNAPGSIGQCHCAQTGRLVVRGASGPDGESRHQLSPLGVRLSGVFDGSCLMEIRLFTDVLPQLHTRDGGLTARLLAPQRTSMRFEMEESSVQLLVRRHPAERLIFRVLMQLTQLANESGGVEVPDPGAWSEQWFLRVRLTKCTSCHPSSVLPRADSQNVNRRIVSASISLSNWGVNGFCEVEYGGPLEVMWPTRFEAAGQVRAFPSYRGQRNFPGWYWAATCSELVSYESWVELGHLMRLDGELDVAAVASQLFRLSWRYGAGGRRIKHTPDYFLRRRDGTAVVLEVRPNQRIEPEDAAKFAATAAACPRVGWDHERLGVLYPVSVANLRRLSGYRHPECGENRWPTLCWRCSGSHWGCWRGSGGR